MSSNDGINLAVKLEASDKPPHAFAAAMGGQVVALIIAGIVLTPVVVMRAAEIPAASAKWAIFVALIVSGITTMIQARPVWRFGAGYLLFMGTSGAFIAVAISALTLGGLPLLMALIIASALIQFPLAFRLSALRTIITPTVGGTAIMLIGVSVMPHAFALLTKLPVENPPTTAAPACAATTLLVILIGSAFLPGKWRLWAPLMGLIAGAAVGLAYGVVKTDDFVAAAWLGLPAFAWPGIDLSFSVDFWTLLPAFAIVTVVGAIETFGDGVAIQKCSWRQSRATDYRAVQGAVAADGLGNLLSGIFGTLPNTTYSTSVAVVDMTGVAARRVGVWGGAIMLLLAFSPKLAALLLAVPSPVAGAYILVLIVLLFMHGIALVFDGGITYEKTLIAGIGFWLGVGFQQKVIYYDLMNSWTATLLSNGMTSGTLAALLLTLLFGLKRGRRRKLKVPLDAGSFEQVQTWVSDLSRKGMLDSRTVRRLELAVEEAFALIFEHNSDEKERELRLEARVGAGVVELDLIAAASEINIESHMLLLDDSSDDVEQDLGLRMLAASVDRLTHHQYHDWEFLSLTVSSSAPRGD
jgi:NCS2 family nucleobase:cation symporter-2/xanthine permease XanP